MDERCENCKHHNTKNCAMWLDPEIFGAQLESVSPDWKCSKGYERLNTNK